jgi:lipopolysaccharide transport system ATP-binding protein
MAEPAVIRVEKLGKKYVIGHQSQRESYVALRDVLARTAQRLARSTRDLLRGEAIVQGDTFEEFWALKDLSFDIERGDVVGIIGRNGAGKSTLLKVLSRITEPSEGRVAIRGRVASLLEVGTGFHPELTGRENIFLNGAILGMARAEIKRKFDEIVGFAEIDKFLDTPVKRYSSGMHVRLAFAVAAHLEPEILVIDEVLAVGDAEFQKKCLGKMSEVAGAGRTVLFVSHNVAAVENLCSKGLVLQNGRLAYSGDVVDALAHYRDLSAVTASRVADQGHRPSWATPWIRDVAVLDSQGAPRNAFSLGEALTVEMRVHQPGEGLIRRPVMGVVINHQMRGVVAGVNTRMTGFTPEGGDYAAAVFRCTLPRLPLLQGEYSFDVWLGDGPSDVDTITNAGQFSILESDVYGAGRAPFANMGIVFLEPKWAFEETEASVARR